MAAFTSFAQVLNPRKSFRRVLFLQLLDVSRTVDQEFKDLSRIRRRAWRAKPFDSLTRSVERRAFSPVPSTFSDSPAQNQTKIPRIKIRITLLRLRRGGRIRPPSRAQLVAISEFSAAVSSTRSHKSPREHRPPILNHGLKAFQRRQCPRRQQLPRNRFAHRAPHR